MVDEAEGQPAPAGAPEVSAPEPAKVDSQEQHVKDIMAFDPFGPAKPAEAGTDETGKKEGKDEGSGEAKPKPGEAKDPKAAVVPQPEPPKQQGPSQEVQALQAQVATLQALIQQNTQKPQAEQKPGAPKYQLGIPPQVIQGLRSEDEQEFAVSMHADINGIANRLWTDMQEHLSKEVIPQIDQRASAVMQHGTQVHQVHNDFYGEHPNLKNPVLMPLVQNAALQVAQTWTQQGKPITWNKDFAKDIADLVYTVIPRPQPQQQPSPQPKPNTFVAQPGSRPAVSSGNPFADVL